MSGFEFGVGLFPTEPLQKMIHLAKVSEEVGFSHIWVGDSHLIWREAYINMAAMMLNTSKVKLGTGVTNPLTRHPSVVASGRFGRIRPGPHDRRYRFGRQLGGNHGHEAVDAGQF